MASSRIIFGESRSETGERGEDVPKSNPDTPPDSYDPTGVCPRCGRVSNFQVLGSLPVSFGGTYIQTREGEMIPDAIDRVSSLKCSGCGQATVVIEEEWVGDQPSRVERRGGAITWRGVHWWPPPGSANLDDAIPEGLRDSYAEGMRALSARAPRAAAVMLRRTVEGVVRESGSEAAKAVLDERKLAKALQVMADEHVLDKSLASWAAEIRISANAGAHYDPLDDVSEDEASDLAHLARQLLHYLYELPAQLKRARQ
jgi:Domain of unknown function (DUF4145)